MTTVEQQIRNIEQEIRKTPYHKGTEHYIGRLRAKLAKLKDKQADSTSKKSGGGGYAVKKQGDATVVLVGPPSVGKSTLLNKLTNAKSKVAPYAFTTVTVVPGIMKYKDAMLQVLDVPGLIEGAEKGKGKGREVLSVVRGADLLVLMSDIEKPKVLKTISKTLEKNGIRMNKKRPRVQVKKKVSGGIQIVSNIKQDFDKETVKEVAKEFRIANAEITIKEKLTLNQLIDAFSKNRVYIPAINILNKSDLIQTKATPVGTISAETGTNLDKLREEIWEKLELVRIFLVKKDEEPGNDNPIIMKEGQKLNDVAKKIGEEFAEGKEKAKIWGTGAKYPGQIVSLNKVIQEGMQIRFV